MIETNRLYTKSEVNAIVEAVLDRLHHEYYEVDEDSLDTLIEVERIKLEEKSM